MGRARQAGRPRTYKNDEDSEGGCSQEERKKAERKSKGYATWRTQRKPRRARMNRGRQE